MFTGQSAWQSRITLEDKATRDAITKKACPRQGGRPGCLSLFTSQCRDRLSPCFVTCLPQCILIGNNPYGGGRGGGWLGIYSSENPIKERERERERERGGGWGQSRKYTRGYKRGALTAWRGNFVTNFHAKDEYSCESRASGSRCCYFLQNATRNSETWISTLPGKN
jgi:hypothetical protein